MATHNCTQSPAPWRDACTVSRYPNGSVTSDCIVTGTRAELLELGYITAETRLPKNVPGWIEAERGDGWAWHEKVVSLAGGRYRVSLGSALAAARDPPFRRFLAAAIAP